MNNSGNTILVTGGGSGIGQALARRLNEAGNTVIVAGRNAGALAETIGGRADMHAVPFDVTDPAALGPFVAEVTTRFPALNLLVNNAGIMRDEPIRTPRGTDDAEAMIATNLLGPIRLIDALIGHLAVQPGAAILNVTSGLAFVPLAATPTYSATKAALHSYTQSLRRALAGKIEVIEIAPPGVRTDLQPGQSEVEAFMPLDAFTDEVMDLLAQDPTPPEILVKAVRFLRDAEAEGRYEAAFAAVNSH